MGDSQAMNKSLHEYNISLCCLTIAEVDIGGMVVEIKLFHH